MPTLEPRPGTAPHLPAADAGPAPAPASHQVSRQALAADRVMRRLAATSPPWLHGEVARRMAERLDLLRHRPTRLLNWWNQAGGGSDLLRAKYPEARLDAVETHGPATDTATPARLGLIAALAQRWLGGSRADTPPARRPDSVEAGQAELLWSNMMLHWCSDVPAVFAHWHRALAVDGLLMFSCLGPDTLAALRPFYAALGWGPPAGGFADMHDLGDALVAAGFADPVMDMEVITLTWPDADSLLAELRSLGSNTAPGRHAGLRTPGWRRHLQEELGRALTTPDGRLGLSFEIVYGHAVRPVTRIAVKPDTRISVEAMREMTRKRGGHATP